MESIETTFIDFLKSQQSTLEILNSFSKFKDDTETYLHSVIKNQSSILNGVNSLNGNFTKSLVIKEKSDTITPDTDQKVILRKATDNNNDAVSNFYDTFQSFFNGTFCKSMDLTDETIKVFSALIDSIDDTNASTIENSIKLFRSAYTKQNGGKLITAKKSNAKFVSSIIKTIEKLCGKKIDTVSTTLPGDSIDKGYFASKFKTSKENITAIIDNAIEYGKIDDTVINGISIYLAGFRKDIPDTEIGLFINYIKQYIV